MSAIDLTRNFKYSAPVFTNKEEERKINLKIRKASLQEIR